MSTRDVIARACFDPGDFVAARQLGETTDQWRARAVLTAITAAGYRILGPDELDQWTVERCADVIDTDGKVNGIDRDRLAESIRALSPEAPQPEAKEARTETWPSGCHSPNSCTRHMACMYTNCRHENRPIKAEIEAALKAKEARDGR